MSRESIKKKKMNYCKVLIDSFWKKLFLRKVGVKDSSNTLAEKKEEPVTGLSAFGHLLVFYVFQTENSNIVNILMEKGRHWKENERSIIYYIIYLLHFDW